MLDFFINNAWAAPAQQQADGTTTLIMMVGMFAIFYFLLIRPQLKQAKQHRQLVSEL